MKKSILTSLIAASAVVSTFTSCGSSKIDYSAFSATNAPEEAGIVFTRISAEGASVIGATDRVANYLAINNKGDKLAYLSRADQNDNIYTIDLANRNISQQRTYRNNVTGGFVYSPNDEEILFNSSSDILSTNASTGAICKQVTTGWWPVYSPDGKYVFFQRNDGKQNVLWRYAVSNKELATLCSGAGVSPSKTNSTIYFLRYLNRNGKNFNEIRKFNYETGSDEVILSNENLNPSTVQESPDGKWLLFAANKYTVTGKKGSWNRIQLYVVRTDGTELTQLTYHISGSFSPVWSRNGKEIYFISGRGNAQQKYAIWSMPFRL